MKNKIYLLNIIYFMAYLVVSAIIYLVQKQSVNLFVVVCVGLFYNAVLTLILVYTPILKELDKCFVNASGQTKKAVPQPAKETPEEQPIY